MVCKIANKIVNKCCPSTLVYSTQDPLISPVRGLPTRLLQPPAKARPTPILLCTGPGDSLRSTKMSVPISSIVHTPTVLCPHLPRHSVHTDTANFCAPCQASHQCRPAHPASRWWATEGGLEAPARRQWWAEGVLVSARTNWCEGG